MYTCKNMHDMHDESQIKINVGVLQCVFVCICMYVSVSTHRHTSQYLHKEGNVLFNDALNTFYLQLYGVRHMVKEHSDSERGNPLLPYGLLFPISSKGSFICTIIKEVSHGAVGHRINPLWWIH